MLFNGWMIKLWYIYSLEYYSATKTNYRYIQHLEKSPENEVEWKNVNLKGYIICNSSH